MVKQFLNVRPVFVDFVQDFRTPCSIVTYDRVTTYINWTLSCIWLWPALLPRWNDGWQEGKSLRWVAHDLCMELGPDIWKVVRAGLPGWTPSAWGRVSPTLLCSLPWEQREGAGSVFFPNSDRGLKSLFRLTLPSASLELWEIQLVFILSFEWSFCSSDPS